MHDREKIVRNCRNLRMHIKNRSDSYHAEFHDQMQDTRSSTAGLGLIKSSTVIRIPLNILENNNKLLHVLKNASF